MIVYDLVCGKQHRFEGWFGSAEDFARQRESALVRCPLCDDAAIQRTPSANIQVGRTPAMAASARNAPASQSSNGERANGEGASAEASGDASVPVSMPDAKMLALLRKLVSETENVGRAFPEEARKIHYDEAPKRGIRGQATSEEADALREEGIDFMSLPGILTRDLS
jgi:hypothetical protein